MVLQLYLIEQFDVTQKENSIIQMMMGICLMFVSALGLPMLRKNFTEPQLIILGIFAFIIASLQFCYFAHFYQLAIILPAFSFGMGVINPVCESLLSSAVEPQEQALMLGLSTSSFTFMQAIAPGIGGLILQNYGFHLCGILGVLGSTTALVIGYLFPIVDKNFKAKMS
uniref:Major facilitator superfamily (MFS) profile domain-containing protein n=1 Tax=Panagrolaimus sp. JU765 TaxID=591449 RepID=A0AC34R7C2_9BILA